MDIRKNFSRILKGLSSQTGFTLVELLVVIGMLSILLIGLILTFNPFEQYSKAQDASRESDLEQVQRAMDTYFNDTGCYPASIPFGQEWNSGSTIYMEKVPQDPLCAINKSKCYLYETDTTNTCPQWGILYAGLQSAIVPANACPLSLRSQCVPNGYGTSGYNYCVLAGNVDCSLVQGFTFPNSGGGSGSTPTPTGGSGGNGFSCPGNQYYACTGDDRCNNIAPASQCTQNGGSLFCHCDQHCDQSCKYN